MLRTREELTRRAQRVLLETFGLEMEFYTDDIMTCMLSSRKGLPFYLFDGTKTAGRIYVNVYEEETKEPSYWIRYSCKERPAGMFIAHGAEDFRQSMAKLIEPPKIKEIPVF